jgi:hypothetical protein
VSFGRARNSGEDFMAGEESQAIGAWGPTIWRGSGTIGVAFCVPTSAFGLRRMVVVAQQLHAC